MGFPTVVVNPGSGTGSQTINTLPNAGQATMANSLPVAIASDQSAIPVSGAVTANLGTLNGAATEATLAAVKAALLAQIDLADLIVTDNTGAFFVRRESVNEGTGAITVTFTTLAGAAASPNAASLAPANGSSSTRVVETVLFDATAGGTGYSTGDVIARVLVYDTAANSVVASYWHDLTTGAAIASAPAAANLQEQARTLPVGAATAVKQAAPGVAGTPSADVVTVQGNAAGVPVPVSMADGASLALGAKADVAPANPAASGSVVAVLKGIWGALLARMLVDTVVPATSTNRSGTIGTGGGQQTLAPANAARRGFTIQNQSSGPLYWSTLGAATLDQNAMLLNAGDYYESATHHVGTGAISIIGATTGQAFYSREF